MATELQWAFIKGETVAGDDGAGASGDNPLTYNQGTSDLNGSSNLTYNPSTKVMKMSAGSTLVVTGSGSSPGCMAINLVDQGAIAGYMGLGCNRRLISYEETIPANCVGEVFGTITVDACGSLTIKENSHLVIKTWPY